MGKETVVLSELECGCGETLRYDKDDPRSRRIYLQYEEHMKRSDHKPTGGQWTDAHEKIQESRERAKVATKDAASTAR